MAWRLHDRKGFTEQKWLWGPIDEQLCGLVDRLNVMGYHHTLEAEVRLTAIDGDYEEYDFTKFLPKFREKGVVTVIDAARDRIFHSSPRNR